MFGAEQHARKVSPVPVRRQTGWKIRHEHAGAERGAVRSDCASLRSTWTLAARPGLGDEFLQAGIADDARNQGVADHERRSPADAEDPG